MIIIFNPSVFYYSLIEKNNKDTFGGSNIKIGYVLIDKEGINLLGVTTEDIFYAKSIFIDDYNSSFLIEKEFIKSLLKSNRNELCLKSLVEFWESKFKMAAIFEDNNIIYYPKYLEKLHPKKAMNLFLRTVDILACILLLPLVLLILFISAFLLFFIDGTPIFFKQDRVGLNSKLFKIFKIRTMINSSNKEYTTINDKRIFPFGKLLRSLKIDELPQLLNIFLGQMSIIGPRPERVDLHNEIMVKIKNFDKRLIVRPGLTGWAQIYAPTATPSQSLEKLKYDIYFIKNASLSMLLKIFISTLAILLKRTSL